jgi:hypothetical protein
MSQRLPSTSSPALALDQLLRDLRLKVYREVALELKRNALWVDDETFRESLRVIHTQGKALAEELIARLLGRHDYWWLDASRVFGGRKPPLSARLPRILSFGFDLGSGMAGGGARSDDVARLCALFNFTISIFDAFCDRAHDGPGQLSKYVHPKMLQALTRDRKAIGRFWTQVEAIKNFELRCVLKLVCAFFSEVRVFTEPAGPVAGAALEDLVLRAYGAEMMCASWQGGSRAVPSTDVVRQKSILPFQIMWQIARMDNGVPPCSDALVSSIGEVFGLQDDLVDLPKDLRRGQVNSIICEIESVHDDCVRSTASEKALALLTQEHVADAARRLCATLLQVLDGLDRASRLRSSILLCTRSCVAQAGVSAYRHRGLLRVATDPQEPRQRA